jgi:hypothetical protein
LKSCLVLLKHLIWFLISSCTSDIFWHFPQSQEPQRKARMSVCH